MIEHPRDLVFEIMFNDQMKPNGDKIKLNEEDDEDEEWNYKKAQKGKRSGAITIDSCF